MKNYPNQASDIQRIRQTLQAVANLNVLHADSGDDGVLGYHMVEEGIITFRGSKGATPAQLATRIQVEKAKQEGHQAPRTTARELRRTLRDLGWLNSNTEVTTEGQKFLGSVPGSVDEQALLVEALLGLEVTFKDGTSPHHPIPVMLMLLADQPSLHRAGLELALEPRDDSKSELHRVRQLYKMSKQQRQAALGITDAQLANAVKIFPKLALTAGLIVKDGHGVYSLSQDGWNVLGLAPGAAKQTIAKRAKRRTTVGKKVTSKTVAKKTVAAPPRTLTPAEQAQAAKKLAERTADHQALVTRVAEMIGDGNGAFFEDEFSYDLLWVPDHPPLPVVLFEMKTVTTATDSDARVRAAVGQLSWYEYFKVAPDHSGREIIRVAAFDTAIPKDLAEYLEHEKIGALVAPTSGLVTALNPRGQALLDSLPATASVP